MSNYINWENNTLNWENESSLWNEAFEPATTENTGAGRNPEELNDISYQQTVINKALREQLLLNLDRLRQENAIRLIEVFISVDDKNYINKKQIKHNKDIKITFSDVKLI